MKRISWSLVFCLLFAWAAYDDFTTEIMPPSRYERDHQLQQDAHALARESLRRTYACLANDISDFCNRDLSYEQRYQGGLATARKYNFASDEPTHSYGLYILISIFFGWLWRAK